ncbi:hypothetical protein [Microbulbifer sp. VAAF005]|uniref:hypothetical protein n=1 Tax=Microbulbifer sp. VAAF005 TaxID=3034230 RepID=UPI0024AD52DA|nr:hypothetical protein [Microbulbifer sp. VAAF005]WHI45952.1 hypothetical protein P0078_19870 [Microbulbifer sp. VAAF005]
MNMDSGIRSKLREIFRKSEVVFAAPESLGNPDLVPFCEQILELYKLKDTVKEDFEETFIEDFDIFKECTWELAQVCMYHLRLKRYKAHLEKQLREAQSIPDFRAIPVIEHILDAYQDPWKDKELFYDQLS